MADYIGGTVNEVGPKCLRGGRGQFPYRSEPEIARRTGTGKLLVRVCPAHTHSKSLTEPSPSSQPAQWVVLPAVAGSRRALKWHYPEAPEYVPRAIQSPAGAPLRSAACPPNTRAGRKGSRPRPRSVSSVRRERCQVCFAGRRRRRRSGHRRVTFTTVARVGHRVAARLRNGPQVARHPKGRPARSTPTWPPRCRRGAHGAAAAPASSLRPLHHRLTFAARPGPFMFRSS